MIDQIEQAVRALEEMIDIVENQLYQKFLEHLTPRIQEMVDRDSFQDAMNLHKRMPLSRAMIDLNASQVIAEGEIKLKMVGGRTLCTFIKSGEIWQADNVFWK